MSGPASSLPSIQKSPDMMITILVFLTTAILANCGDSTMNIDEAALQSIEELHEKDKKAALDGDLATLLSLFTEDGIAIPASGEIVQGKDALRRMLEENQKLLKEYRLVEYNQDFREISLSGAYAYEWGYYSGKYVSKKDGQEIIGSGKLMRILKLGQDGTWRVFRAIWTVDP